MQPSKLKILLYALAAFGIAGTGAVHAQYVWLDHSGIKQYSDMPPPASVPAAQILKSPAGVKAGATPVAAPAAPTASSASASAAKGAPSLAERNADFNKRRAEQAEQEKKSAAEKQLALEKSNACARARQYQRTLASGTRLASVDQNGAPVLLDEAQRAHEAQEAARVLKDCGSN